MQPPEAKFVAMQDGAFALVIDLEHAVRQIQHQLARARARLPHVQRLELEHQIVAERPVQPEHRILRARERRAQRPHHREDTGNARALLLREQPIRDSRSPAEGASFDLVAGSTDQLEFGGVAAQCGAAGGEQQLTAAVEGPQLKAAAARLQYQRRIDEPEVVTFVAARVFVTRGEQDAAALVERAGQAREFGRSVDRDAAAMDFDSGFGDVVADLRFHDSGLSGPHRVRNGVRRASSGGPFADLSSSQAADARTSAHAISVRTRRRIPPVRSEAPPSAAWLLRRRARAAGGSFREAPNAQMKMTRGRSLRLRVAKTKPAASIARTCFELCHPPPSASSRVAHSGWVGCSTGGGAAVSVVFGTSVKSQVKNSSKKCCTSDPRSIGMSRS